MMALVLLIQIAHFFSCEISLLFHVLLQQEICGDFCADAAQEDNVIHTIVTLN